MTHDPTVSVLADTRTAADSAQHLLLDWFERCARHTALERAISSLSEDERLGLHHRIDDLATRLDALIEATRCISRHLPLDELLHGLIGLISDAFNADRSTLFLYDADNDELFSRVAQGDLVSEIRFASKEGIAGSVFSSGVSAIVPQAYADPRFSPRIDAETGYRTASLLCVPVRARDGQVIGVTEVLNKRVGEFTAADQALLEAFTTHTAIALENAHLVERARVSQREESRLVEITQAISSELDLDKLLRKIMQIATDLLDAERSTLFLHDPRRGELWSRVAEGIEQPDIRLPDRRGIAGHVFRTRTVVNIRDAYADARFNQDVDQQTGYRTQTVLCVPVIDKMGSAVGVMQVLNKNNGGHFSRRDERRLELLAAQSAIALDNARLFRDVLQERNYCENVLRSLTNGVITLDDRHRIETVNDAALRTLKRDVRDVLGRSAEQVFTSDNRWILGAVRRVNESRLPDTTLDATYQRDDGESISVNVISSPIYEANQSVLGSMLVIEDITAEKRIRGAMSRYMNKELVDQLLAAGDAALGGCAQQATILFADIRNFTNISERLGPQGTVAMLNQFFTTMVDVIFKHGGILDKYIGDAIMAVFGTPFPAADDAERAVRVAIEMLEVLARLNRERVAAGHEPIEIRIGINSDEVVAGNIGSVRRMDYTVVGDGVNLASRLESANKFFGTRILASGSTVRQLSGRYLLRELDLIRVRGRELPVALFEVMGRWSQAETNAAQEFIGHFERGLRLYRASQFQDAIGAFAVAQALRPDDRPCRIFIERSRRYMAAPPSSDWDGVWSLREN
ncbi:MAG: GAF domain-containing protein [Gammaproteobacteria bacterium]|nr:GAF domain-containing protein [Gammaproteobacteria bacterium]